MLTTVGRWLETKPEGSEEPAVKYSLAAAHQVQQQDVEITEAGTAVLRKGVAKERRISIEDAQMRAFPQESQCAGRWLQTACGT